MKYADMSPEQRERRRAYNDAYNARARADRTPEQVARKREYANAYTARQRMKRSDLPPDELEVLRAYNRIKQAERRAKFTEEQRAARQEYDRAGNARLRLLVLTHYGGEPPTCACCGEPEIHFLAIDHINGGGGKHRREISGRSQGGDTMARWLKRNDFPDGFRVLCHNCNFALGHYGACPHDKNRVVPIVREKEAQI